MDKDIQEIKEKLGELMKITTENERVLHVINRRAKWSGVISVIKWLFVVGLTIGSFVYIQPYFDTFMKAYSKIAGGGSSSNNFLDILKNFSK